MALRRRRLPEHLVAPFDTFRSSVEALGRGKAALTESVPGTRLPGRPLAETLVEFEGALREAAELQPGWRSPELEEQWRAAASALETCREDAERLRLEAEAPQGFEGLIGVVGDLMAPLDAFAAAAERFRELRR